ncbi:MAG TPA: hypothetical protein VN635_09205 [Conexibacter sp.]|nr:hypothetical protein [Conexibacter sp.]
MFGPTTLAPPFAARAAPSPEAFAQPDGSFGALVSFAFGGIDVHASATLAAGFLVPDTCRMVIAVFNMSVLVNTLVSAVPFTPCYASSEGDVELAIFRASAPGIPVATRQFQFDLLRTVAGRQEEGGRLTPRVLMLAGRLNPPARPRERLEFTMTWTAVTGGGGVVAAGRTDVFGVLHSILIGGA